jgi:hypothetical protein
MFKTWLILLTTIVLLLLLISAPEQAHAQWPPFWFSLTPSYEDGRITYNSTFSSRVDWTITNVTFKIPLPEGTRFLEANAQATTSVDFDGAEVTFFTSVIHRPIRDASFVVEVTDPTMAVFTTHAWISWEGDQPGDYLTGEVSLDITQQPLIWEAPARSRLQLEAGATVANEVITYDIYPQNVGGRMQDVKINISLPEQTNFLSAEAQPPFVASFDGQEVSFFALELERGAEVGPLNIKVSTKEVTSPFVVTHAWATWKNVGWSVGRSIAAQEETRSGDIIAQPFIFQRVVSDQGGDVPFSNYDLTSITLQEEGPALKIIFHTAGNLGSVDEPLEFILYIDKDCRADTGQRRSLRGVEYWVRYRHDRGQADINFWDQEKGRWTQATEVKSLASEKMIAVWVPYDLIEIDKQFCWIGQSRNRTNVFNLTPPTEQVPNSNDLRLTQYQLAAITTVANSGEVNDAKPPPSGVTLTLEEGYLIQAGENWRYLKGYGEASYPFEAWRQVDYDDTGWLTGPTGIGYGDNDDATVLDDMRYNYVSVFMRHTFNMPDPTSVQSLILEIDYDDGFVAYLNGTEVARRQMGNAGDSVAYDTEATSNHEADGAEMIDLSAFTGLLLPGKNVLAIQGHNDSKHSSDFSMAPTLSWTYIAQPVEVEASVANLSTTAILTGETNPVDTIPLNDSGNISTSALSPTLSITDLSGKLAVPLDNGWVAYDVHVFSLPDGREIVKIPNARQPDFRFDGQRMLINREGGGIENVFEYNFADGTERQVSDAPRDSHPFYDPWGNRVVYGNSELTVGADGLRHPFIFVQCGLLPPHQEREHWCIDIPRFGILLPAGQMGEIQGTHPVWTANDMIAYNGCNSWAGFAACGIYIVPSSSTKGFSNGFIPRQLTKDTSDIPSDTKGNLIAFTSRRDGDWEAYVMNLNGTGVKNLSNNSISNDGLPTISPDGNWLAFVSDRNEQWAIWVAPVVGGAAQKLFDLPADNPWGDGDRTWTNERISWGP